ncbi:prepilin peptidase [Candidatus Poriferisodalis sp.]|uniref:prepilin peptidase n=1 Tax=Candidatus Poriferisodalis sp. TaxID=3101277 RepID=UPI003AF6D47E
MKGAALVWAAVATWTALAVYSAWTDLRKAIIPRRACWIAGSTIALLLVVAAVSMGDLARYLWTLAGTAGVAALLEAAYRRWPGKLGYGDVRLIIVNSMLAGWWGPAWPWWALLGGALAAWPAAAVSALRRGRDAHIRWAPALSIGTAAVVGWHLWTAGPTG